MANTSAEQIKLLEQKIDDEKGKLKERISKLIDKEKDTANLVILIDEEKAASAKKIEQLKHQKDAIEKREQVRKRKERTRRLIQHGALAEKYFNCPDIATSDFEKFLQSIVNQVQIDKILYEIVRPKK